MSYWSSKFTRKFVKRSLGGEVYAYSEMADHVSLLREFYAHFLDLPLGLVGSEDCERPFTHLKNKKIITEKSRVRHFLATQQASETKGPGNVFWLPGLRNPADGLSKTESDMAPLFVSWNLGRIILGRCVS